MTNNLKCLSLKSLKSTKKDILRLFKIKKKKKLKFFAVETNLEFIMTAVLLEFKRFKIVAE